MKRAFRIFALFLLVSASAASAEEYKDGKLRLVLHPKTGRFSLYSIEGEGSRPLFSDNDPRTSFLSILVNGRAYKIGDTSAFKVRLDTGKPLFTFESSFLTVTKEFSFVKSAGEADALRVTITLENRGSGAVRAGARFLLDTGLSETERRIAFSTDQKTIDSETLLTATNRDSYWLDRNGGVSLAGSLNTGSPLDPDSVHFANWKKLADADWKAVFERGRNFNNPPYSVKDAALCYYFDPRPLDAGEKRVFGFTLAPEGAAASRQAALPESPLSGPPLLPEPEDAAASLPAGEDAKKDDLTELREIMARIDALSSPGAASEEELAELEKALNALRTKHGLDAYPRKP